MVGARLSALVALLLLAVPSHISVLAQEACKEDVLGQSSIIGSKQKGSIMVDRTDLAAKGPITRVSLYYSKNRGCLKAAKAAFGDPPVPGVIGSTADSTEHALKLQPGEVITKAEYKADKCIEYLKLTTSKGRSVSAGHVGPVADVMTSAPTAGSGQLLAIKGSTKPNQGKKHGALQHLQLVWGSTKCTKVSTAAAETLKPESGTLSDGAAAAAGPGACKPRVDMCNEKASMNAFTYCVWNAPFSAPSCRGGCCFSSGKCASSSCAISGMGRDVPNMICYGVNSGFGLGGNSNCGGLACKLATPGCTTDAFGGNCVGTVVAFAARDEISPESLKFVGAPCLDATPSDTTLDASGTPASGEEGIYMGKLWTVCDCAEGGTGLPEPASRLLNLTTSRISNFTKNEVLAAFSTFLPQKNVTDEADPNGKGKVVTLLPSFAEMFKFPSLSSISLPNFIGNLTGAKGGKEGSVSAPKLPDLQGLLGQIKPEDASSSASVPGLNFENGALPNGTKAELMMVKPEGSAASEKPPRTLGSLLSRFTKPKEESNGDGSSTFTPGTTEADKSSTKVMPMTLGSLFGGLRRAGPDTSTATAGPAAGPAGNSTRKLDLAPIGALISKFINGPQAAAPAAAPIAAASTSAAPTNASAAAPAVTQSAPAKSATAAKIQAVQPGPAPVQPAKPPGPASPAPRAPGPAMIEAPKKGTFHVPPVGTPTPESAQDPLPVDPNHIAGDPKDRPKTLGERVREQKLAKAAGKEVPADPAPTPAQPKVQISRSRFSAPGIKRPQDDPIWVATGMTEQTLMLNLQALTAALQTGAGAGADDLMRFGDLLAQLQKVPGGLGALPADVSTALMTLAAEVNRVTSGGAPTTAAAEQPAATPAPAAEQPVATPTPAAEQTAATPAAPATGAKPADKAVEKPTAAAPAPPPAAPTPAATAATPAQAATGAESKEQPKPQQQQQQQQPVQASLASSSSSSSSKEVPTTAPAAAAAAAAVPSPAPGATTAVATASKAGTASADSKKNSTPPAAAAAAAAAAGQAYQTAAVTAESKPADSKPAPAAAAAPSAAKPAEVASDQPKVVSKQQ